MEWSNGDQMNVGTKTHAENPSVFLFLPQRFIAKIIKSKKTQKSQTLKNPKIQKLKQNPVYFNQSTTKSTNLANLVHWIKQTHKRRKTQPIWLTTTASIIDLITPTDSTLWDKEREVLLSLMLGLFESGTTKQSDFDKDEEVEDNDEEEDEQQAP